MKEESFKRGEVRTNKVGSETQFEICTLEEWEKMTEEEQQAALIEAMWKRIDVYPID